jgi:hypothetical protein
MNIPFRVIKTAAAAAATTAAKHTKNINFHRSHKGSFVKPTNS